MFQQGENHRSEAPRALDPRELHDVNAAMLLRIAYRITGSAESAQDVVQDSFMKLVEKDMRFPGPDDARYWLIRVVKNAALNVAKRRGREERAYGKWWRTAGRPVESVEAGAVPLAETGADAGVSAPADEDLLRRETAEEVRRALALLPAHLREVLVLKEYGGMNYREIAKVVGIREGNVKVRAFRAREALQKLLEERRSDVS